MECILMIISFRWGPQETYNTTRWFAAGNLNELIASRRFTFALYRLIYAFTFLFMEKIKAEKGWVGTPAHIMSEEAASPAARPAVRTTRWILKWRFLLVWNYFQDLPTFFLLQGLLNPLEDLAVTKFGRGCYHAWG